MKKINCCFKKKSLLHRLLNLGLGVLLTISLFPLPIQAQALTSPFLGINFQVTAYGENMSSIVLPKINIDSINSTVPSGYISGQLNCTSPSTPTSSNPCDIYSFQNTSGAAGTGNGTRIYLNLQNYLLEANGNATINHQSYFFIDYEFILDDNYKGYVTITDADSNTRTIYVNGNQFHYQRMQLDVSEKAITIDDYDLVRVTDSLMWQFPLESYSIISKFIGNEYVPYLDNTYYVYPIFDIPSDYRFRSKWGTTSDTYKQTFIFGINRNIFNVSTFNTYFQTENITIDSVIEIYRNDYGGNLVSFVKVKFHVGSSGNYSYFTTKENINIIPIWLEYDTNSYASQEFAERFNLYNQKASYTSANDVNSQFQTDANSLISIEDSFNSSMNSNLDNINPTFNMGSSFLASANWVSTQFNRIVNNTPFASLITFGLTLGLGLLIIGKIRK